MPTSVLVVDKSYDLIGGISKKHAGPCHHWHRYGSTENVRCLVCVAETCCVYLGKLGERSRCRARRVRLGPATTPSEGTLMEGIK